MAALTPVAAACSGGKLAVRTHAGGHQDEVGVYTLIVRSADRQALSVLLDGHNLDARAQVDAMVA